MAQLALIALGVLTTREFTTVFLAAPVAACAVVAAWRNRNAELDSIDMFWILSTIFFFIRPAQTLANYTATMYNAAAPFQYTPLEVYMSFIVMYIFSFANLLLLPRDAAPRFNKDITPKRGLLAASVIFAVVNVVLLNGGTENLLAARYDKAEILPVIAAAEGLLIASATIILANFSKQANRRLRHYIYAIIAGVALIVVFNPLNTSRFGLIAAWLPVVLIALPILRKPLVFTAVTIATIVIVMPILSVTTRFGFDLGRVYASSEKGSLDTLPYIDTYDALLHGIYYAHNVGYAFGAKAISIIFCFVPRSIWPDKPIVSALDIGYQLYNLGYVGTPNLSMPLPGDFYMDFGIAGVVIGSIGAALGFRALLMRQISVRGQPLFGFLILASLPIVVRGAVAAVILLAASTLVAYCVLAIFAGKSTAENWRGGLRRRSVNGGESVSSSSRSLSA